jgi:hypothetical protein
MAQMFKALAAGLNGDIKLQNMTIRYVYCSIMQVGGVIRKAVRVAAGLNVGWKADHV